MGFNLKVLRFENTVFLPTYRVGYIQDVFILSILGYTLYTNWVDFICTDFLGYDLGNPTIVILISQDLIPLLKVTLGFVHPLYTLNMFNVYKGWTKSSVTLHIMCNPHSPQLNCLLLAVYNVCCSIQSTTKG